MPSHDLYENFPHHFQLLCLSFHACLNGLPRAPAGEVKALKGSAVSTPSVARVLELSGRMLSGFRGMTPFSTLGALAPLSLLTLFVSALHPTFPSIGSHCPGHASYRRPPFHRPSTNGFHPRHQRSSWCSRRARHPKIVDAS